MATTEPGISPPATSGEVGRHLRTVRKAKGLSRAEVARSAGLTRRELAAYERGRTPVPDSDLWCLAGSCGVDVSELLPSRDKLTVGSDLGSLTVGESVRRLRAGAGGDGLLREYLAMIYELRNLPPGARPPMREEDLAALSDALGGTPEAIESRLGELIGASRDEAARLRVMILPPRALSAASPMTFPPMGEFGDLNQYGAAPVPPPPSIPTPPLAETADAAAPMPFPPGYDFALTSDTTVGDPEATARFFDAPRADDDPFAPPPPMEALAPLDVSAAAVVAELNSEPLTAPTIESMPEAMTAPTVESMPEPFPAPLPAPLPAPVAEPHADVVASTPPATFDPFAPPSVAPIDPFASPPSGPPLGVITPPGGLVDPINPPTAFAHNSLDPGNSFDPSAFDPSAFDPSAFDPMSFDPGAFVADPFNAPLVYDAAPLLEPSAFATEPAYDPFGVDAYAGDPFGVEVVALGPDSATPIAHPADNGAAPSGEDWMATWESLGQDTLADEALSSVITGPLANEDDDPWAVLRIPVEGMVVDDGSDALALVDTVEPFEVAEAAEAVEVAGAVETTEPSDPFANAFEPVAHDTLAFESRLVEAAASEISVDAMPVTHLGDLETADFDTDEPADDWFDRAAAATAALVADHRASTVDDTSALDEGVLPNLETDQPVTEALVSDEPTDDTFDGEDGELIAAAVTGLAPIVWSLYPPTPEPTPEPTFEGSTDDADPTAEAEAFTAASDSEFVTAGPDWEVGGIFPATAMADDGTLALRRADVRWALSDLVANDDFTVRATVDFTSGAGFGILFRVSTDDSERITGYSFDVDPIYSGGGFLLRQWHDSRQHWKPLAHAPVADSSRLYGQHTIEVTLRGDQLTTAVDGETVLTVLQLSRCSIESGREPCRGGRLGVQAWSTTEVTVGRLMLANL